MKDKGKNIKLTKVLFFIYLISVFWIIVFKLSLPFSELGYMRSINLIPFSESLIINGRLDFSEIIMNVVIFIPIGIYSEILFKEWTVSKKIFLFFLISLMCEVSQFILGIGASDITDIINNILGGTIGLLIYRAIERYQKTVLRHRNL
ncbi:VanZ family protein [Schnuerera sp. xch1]|uniref:VanZ family protein n=1 Tax=Schnuerera sp. xch1 TaxID=2874283 RepID=UPI001CC05AAD|nr:VanZ family protein [Schnuerera sp. xch1]MBZ2175601.1 VanZ family protein [Schnuerera sp. xch1]